MLFKEINHQIKDIDKSSGMISAYANVYNNLDSYDEISMPGSFDKTVQEQAKRIRVLKDHNSTMSLGVPKEMNASDPYGLYTVTQFNMKKDLAKDMFTDIQLCCDNKQNADLSIGYEIMDYEVIKSQDKQIQQNKEYKLYEYSFLTGWGANSSAIVTGIKSEQDIILLLTQKYNLPYSDTRLREIETILKSLTKSPVVTITIPVQPILSFNSFSLVN